MRAKVIVEFPGRPDNEVLTRTIAKDEVIFGDLASVAVREGWAEEEKDDDGDARPNFSKMTVDQIRAFAAEHQIDLGQATLKADLIAAVSAVPANPE